MEERTINVISHESLVKNSFYVYIFHALLIISLVFLVWTLVIKKNNKILLLFLIFLAYSSFVFFEVNYRTYLITKNISEGIQGRYLFPVLGPLVIVMAYSLLSIFKNKLINLIIFVVVSGFFIYSDFGYLVKNYHQWYFLVPGLSHEFGNVGEINKGQSSPRQIFNFKKDLNKNYGLGIYVSTYGNKIKKGYVVNLYDDRCQNLIWSFEPKKIRDSFYLVIKLPEYLNKNMDYCFDIENKFSEKPITVWYSSVDLPGNILDNEDKDLVYDLLDRITTERFK